MKPPDHASGNQSSEEGDGAGSGGLRIPPIQTLLHFLWLHKWLALGTWVLLALPLGVLFSVWNIPKSYTATTVMRFPAVVGAQTNVMRDVAITQGESIISILNSFQVLERTIQKLHLRVRISTPDVFHRKVFKSLKYGESLGLGNYTLVFGGNNQVTLLYMPRGSEEEYTLYSGRLKDGRLSVRGLEAELQEAILEKSQGMAVDFSFSTLEETALYLKKSLSTLPRGPSNFEIRLKDRDPWLVADILNTVREEFLEVYYGTTEVQDVGILVQMEKDLEVSKEKLTRSQDELSRYYAAHPELSQEDTRSGGDQIAYLDARQDLDRIQQVRTRIQAAVRAKPSGSPEQVHFWALELLGSMTDAGEPKASIIRSSLQELIAKQTSLKASLGPEHPKIAEVEAQKGELYKQIEQVEEELRRRLDQEATELKSRMSANAPSRQTTVPVKVRLELERLNSENQNNQTIYERLLESYNRAKLVTGTEFFKVTVVDPARPALYTPPSLSTRLLVAGGVTLGLLIVIPALFAAWPLVFRRVWTREDVRRLLGVKHLGTVTWNATAEARPKAAPKGETASSEEPPSGVPGKTHPLLVFHGSGHTVEDLESYRVLREETESHFRGSAGKLCLLITSTRPNEGKTLTASNMAMTFARKGKRTLLIDADFRLGRVSRIFNLPPSTGVDELLSQPEMTDSQFLEMASLCFQPTVQRNLVVAPRNRSNPGAGELVSSDRFKAFIRLAREQFDVVLIDTPPIMITPEPLSLTEVVDGVVFVCLSGGTVVADAAEAVSILKERGVRVGSILNGVRPTPFTGNRFKKYSYYYQAHTKPGEPSGA